MIYEYKCPECGWAGDRVSRIDDRDNKFCTHNLGTAEQLKAYTEAVKEDPDTDVKDPRCGAKLERIVYSQVGQNVVVPDDRFRPGAVTKAGKIIPGNWGHKGGGQGPWY